MKKTKAAKIAKMLNNGNSVAVIKRMLGVSESYIYVIKNKLMEAAAATAAEAETLTEAIKAKAGEYVVVEGALSVQEIDAILNQRATTYGAFKDVARMAQRLKNVIRLTDIERRGGTLPLDHQETLDMIASKIARIVVGDYDHVDSWIDIAGYATVVADRLQGKAR